MQYSRKSPYSGKVDCVFEPSLKSDHPTVHLGIAPANERISGILVGGYSRYNYPRN